MRGLFPEKEEIRNSDQVIECILTCIALLIIAACIFGFHTEKIVSYEEAHEATDLLFIFPITFLIIFILLFLFDIFNRTVRRTILYISGALLLVLMSIDLVLGIVIMYNDIALKMS